MSESHWASTLTRTLNKAGEFLSIMSPSAFSPQSTLKFIGDGTKLVKDISEGGGGEEED